MMPVLDVPIIKTITADWLRKPRTIKVDINTARLTYYYRVNAKMTDARREDYAGNPAVWVVPSVVVLITPVQLKTVVLPAEKAMDAQHSNQMRPMPSGNYMLDVTVEVGWWKRILYWDWSRPPFLRWKIDLVRDEAIPLLAMSKYVDWQ